MLGHCLSSATVAFPRKLPDAISVTAQQAEAGEPSSPFDHPPIRARPTQHRTLHSGEAVQDSSHFFNFLLDHVTNAGPGVQWNPFVLRTAYRKAHPNHVGYSCWVNIIPASGTPPRPSRRYEIHCPTNTGLRVPQHAETVPSQKCAGCWAETQKSFKKIYCQRPLHIDRCADLTTQATTCCTIVRSSLQ